MNTHTRTRFVGRTLALCGLGVLLGALASGGCYRRVIYAHGLGSESIQVEQPYQESGQLDNWIFGEQPPTRRGQP